MKELFNENGEIIKKDIPFYNISLSIYKNLILWANHSPPIQQEDDDDDQQMQHEIFSLSDYPYITYPHSNLLSMVAEWESVFKYVYSFHLFIFMKIYVICLCS